MEKTILEAEARVTELEVSIQSNVQKPELLRELSQNLKRAQDDVERLYARWAELAKQNES